MKNKIIGLFSAGIIALTPLYGQPKINFDLASPSPTSSSTSSPLLIKPNINKNIQLVNKFTNKRGELMNVKVTLKDSNSITVNNEGSSVKVTYDANTHFRRKFWGKSSFAEISVGDNIDVIGKWTNEEKTQMKAVLIRNLSIQKRYGVFFGTVKSLTDTGFVITTIRKGEETVTVDPSTKLINRVEDAITVSDIAVGHKIRIKGLWDSLNFTIKEVKEIKNFSLPEVEKTGVSEE